MADGECQLDIRHLDCREHSGFTIRNMQTLLTVSGQKLYLENTTFDAISGSRIDMDFRFDFDSWQQYAAFQDSVLFRCQLRPSLLHATDLTYFSPALQGIEPVAVQLQGKVENSLSHLEIKQFSCYLNDSTHLRGNLFTEGIQHGRTARWDAEIDELAVVMRRLDGWHLPGGKPLQLPEPLKKLIVHQGETDFHGTFDDFSTDVEISGNLGSLRVYGTCNSEKGNRRYDAHLQTRSLQLQELLHSPLLGALTAQGEISGSADNLEDYRLNIQSLHFHGREIRNARLQGDLEEGRLAFQLHSPDSALTADINGFVDFREEKIYYAGELNRFDLSAFHFLPEDSNAVLSLHSQADLTGSFSQGVYGVVKVNGASLTENGNRVRIPPFQLLSDTADNGDMELELRSTPLQASLSGRLRLADLPRCLAHIAQQYLPHSIGKEPATVPAATRFDLAVTMRQSIQLLERLLPKLHIGEGFTLDAHYAEQENSWRMQAEIPSIGWQQVGWENCHIRSDNEADTLRLAAECRQFSWNSMDSLSQLQDVRLQLDCANDTARFRLHNQPGGTLQPPFLDLRGTMRFERFEECILQLQQGVLCLHQAPFDIDPGNEIILEKNSIKVNRFQMNAGAQSMALEGMHSPKQASRVAFRTRNLHLSELESLLLPYGLSLDGIATGALQLDNRHDRLQLTTQMTIDSLVFNEVAYGKLQSDAYWQEEEKQIMLQAKLFPLQDAAPAIHLHGNYKPETKRIDLHGDIRTFNLHTIAPYLSSFATAVEGTASGKLHLSGPLQKTSLTGNLLLEEAFLRIGYINTLYRLQNQNIEILDSAFTLHNVQCTDIQGHPAFLDGKITHHQLKQWGVRLDIRTQNTMVLNTDYRDNDLFYGKAFGTGTIQLRLRPQGDFFLSGDMRTDKQTYISVLLNKGASIQKQQSYIVFEKPFSSSDEAAAAEPATVRTTRTRLTFNLDVTPDATLKVVLDPSIGGTIIGNGSGAIRMELQPERPFEMYGNYTLNEGSVDLALGSILTRTLSIENGSTLKWNGQPDKGEMNVRAIYNTRTSITSLLG
ncbi:MAG: translocation/assembly module TamB domain-containing protein, partial [Bacteroidales bacterium]|nr:translocation/assembly module TamB domain-containing protein [Bacteroidales bacterium]